MYKKRSSGSGWKTDEMDFSATYKVLVLGDSNVGKTCIVHRYCDERYYDTYISTIGIDFKQKLISLDGQAIKLQIWDVSKLFGVRNIFE